jgi:hypothetical protein
MASIGFAFDANSVQPSTAYEALPQGDYEVMIVDSNMEGNKAGTGQFLKLQLQVISGPRTNAVLFVRLNLDNPNPKAVEIAQRDLSAICHAVGVLQVTDSAQLHNRPFIAKVTVKDDPQYGLSNEVKGYKPMGQAQQPAPVAAAPAYAAAPPQAAPAGNAPWMAGKAA